MRASYYPGEIINVSREGRVIYHVHDDEFANTPPGLYVLFDDGVTERITDLESVSLVPSAFLRTNKDDPEHFCRLLAEELNTKLDSLEDFLYAVSNVRKNLEILITELEDKEGKFEDDVSEIKKVFDNEC